MGRFGGRSSIFPSSSRDVSSVLCKNFSLNDDVFGFLDAPFAPESAAVADGGVPSRSFMILRRGAGTRNCFTSGSGLTHCLRFLWLSRLLCKLRVACAQVPAQIVSDKKLPSFLSIVNSRSKVPFKKSIEAMCGSQRLTFGMHRTARALLRKKRDLKATGCGKSRFWLQWRRKRKLLFLPSWRVWIRQKTEWWLVVKKLACIS